MYILRGFLTGFSAYVSLVSIISRIQPSGCSFREPTSNHISLLYIQAQFTEAFKNFLALHSAYSSSIFHTYSHPSSHGEALMLQFSQCFRVAHRLAQISSQISSWYFVKCLLSHTYLVTSIYSSSTQLSHHLTLVLAKTGAPLQSALTITYSYLLCGIYNVAL